MNNPYVSTLIVLALCYVKPKQLLYTWNNRSLAQPLTLGLEYYSVIILTTFRTLITGSMPHYVPFGLVTEQPESYE